MSERARRALWWLCVAGTAGFVGLFGAAMARYSGGTWFDRRAVGHSFWKNFLCDLLHTRALDGADNRPVAALARAGMLAMLAALGAFFALLPELERGTGASDGEGSRAAWLTRRAGVLACALCVAVPLTPSDRFPRAHEAAVLVACAPALVAVLAALRVCLRAPRASRALRALAALTLAAGALDALGYAYAAATLTHTIDAALPALQRVATVALGGWVGATCLALAPRASTAPR